MTALPMLVGLLAGLSILLAGMWVLSKRKVTARQRIEEMVGAEPTQRSSLQKLDYDLRQAGIGPFWTPIRYLALSGVLGVGFFLVTSFLMGNPSPPLIPAAAAVFGLYFLPRGYVDRQAFKQRMTTTKEISELQKFMSQQLNTGRSEAEAISEYAKREVGGSRVVAELRRVERAQQYGINFETALKEAAGRLGNINFDRMVESVLMFRSKSKAELADILMQQARYLDEQLIDAKEERAQLSAPRSYYSTIGFMILGIIIFTRFATPDAFEVFYGSALGQFISFGMLAWWSLGYWLQSRQVRGIET